MYNLKINWTDPNGPVAWPERQEKKRQQCLFKILKRYPPVITVLVSYSCTDQHQNGSKFQSLQNKDKNDKTIKFTTIDAALISRG